MLADNTPLPSVFSISYAWSEGAQCEVTSAGACGTSGSSSAYVVATNAALASVGLMGITIVVSSGDSGSHGASDESCTSHTTLPDWPSASPYILSVGATQLSGGTQLANAQSSFCQSYGCAGAGTEVTCSYQTGALITSGGGFSNVAPRQWWQAAAVASYLATETVLPPATAFNASGRGYPDVAAIGHNLIIDVNNELLIVDGTSCSAPIFAAVIALANAARLAAGLPVLGFMNPALYAIAVSTPGAFHDITAGNNSCTES